MGTVLQLTAAILGPTVILTGRVPVGTRARTQGKRKDEERYS